MALFSVVDAQREIERERERERAEKRKDLHRDDHAVAPLAVQVALDADDDDGSHEEKKAKVGEVDRKIDPRNVLDAPAEDLAPRSPRLVIGPEVVGDGGAEADSERCWERDGDGESPVWECVRWGKVGGGRERREEREERERGEREKRERK